MGSEGPSLSACGRIFLFIFASINVIIFLFGLAAIGVGSYLVVETDKYGYITDHEITAPALILASGVFTCLLTALGFIGACMKKKIALIIYGVILLIVIILQIAAGIYGAVSRTGNNKTEEDYANKLSDAIVDYNSDKSARQTIDRIQKERKCCGVYEPSDWANNGDVIHGNDGQLPESCQCTDTGTNNSTCDSIEPFDYTYGDNLNGTYDSQNTVYLKGCYNETVSLFRTVAVVSSGIGLGFGIFEVIVMIMAFALAFFIHRASGKYEVV